MDEGTRSSKVMQVALVDHFQARRASAEKASASDPRGFRRQRLAAAMRLFAAHGFAHSAPFMGARDPESSEVFWMNPWEKPFARMRASDLIAIDSHTLKIVEGRGVLNMHTVSLIASVLAARPDAVSVAHGHPAHARAWSCANRPLEPISVDSCIFHGEHVLYDEASEGEGGSRLGEALGRGKAAILVNHGPVTVGQSVEEAIFLLYKLELSCETQVMATSFSSRALIPDHQVRKYKETIWQPSALWYGGTAMIEALLESQPDTLG